MVKQICRSHNEIWRRRNFLLLTKIIFLRGDRVHVLSSRYRSLLLPSDTLYIFEVTFPFRSSLVIFQLRGAAVLRAPALQSFLFWKANRARLQKKMYTLATLSVLPMQLIIQCNSDLCQPRGSVEHRNTLNISYALLLHRAHWYGIHGMLELLEHWLIES